MRLQRLGFLSIVALISLLSVPALAQDIQSDSQNRDSGVKPGNRIVAAGQKAKVKGIIIRRDADTFSVADEFNNETVIQLTDQTSVKSKGGFFRSGKDYDVTSLLRGLPEKLKAAGTRMDSWLRRKSGSTRMTSSSRESSIRESPPSRKPTNAFRARWKRWARSHGLPVAKPAAPTSGYPRSTITPCRIR